ncbi:MAG TPA: DUF4159 domain-containing protein [Tepidisphaeraceae bacterium]|nr:DUF4159 domain-containing protein [Tepidisphaeraceae bacterium]
MSYRVKCPACGKVMLVEEDAAGQSVVCIACGTMLQAPRPVEAEAVEAHDAEEPAEAAAEEPVTAEESAELLPYAGGAGSRTSRTPRPAANAGGRRTLLIGAIAAVVIVGATAAILMLLLSRRGGDDRSAYRDLLAMKNEAESLAIQGRLAEAHEKYRRLQELALERDIKDAYFWDVMERAKVDQDKIYMMLLNGMDPAAGAPSGAIPPALAARDDAQPQDTTTAPATEPRPEATGGPRQPLDQYAAIGGTTQPDAAPEATGDATVAEDPNATQPSSQPADEGGAPTTQVALEPEGQGMPVPRVTDEQIGVALKRGIDFLIPQFENGQLAKQPGATPAKQAGLNALCVYALLSAGQAMKDERLNPRGQFVNSLIETMKSHDLRSVRGDPNQPLVYARSLRAAALSVHNRKEDRDALKKDVDWLVAAAMNGAYSYDDQFTRASSAQAPSDLLPLPVPREKRADQAAARERAGVTASPAINAENPHPNPLPAYRKREQDSLFLRAAAEQGAVAPEAVATFAYDAMLLGDDASAPVMPIHGLHDPRTGREIMVPRSNIPLQRGNYPGGRYPTRTVPPRTGTMPGTRMPAGNYGTRAPRWGTTLPPVPVPQRGGNDAGAANGFPWDNSNSQYGLLGVWSGAEVGIEVPQRYWKDVEKHWTGSQLRTGEWGYRAGEPSGSFAMTCGGIASLFVTHDWLAAALVRGNTGRPPLTPPLESGLGWLEKGDNAVQTPNPKTHYVGYDLYGIERVGLACGFKYFGKHDWYRDLAAMALDNQGANGSWGRSQEGTDTLIDTAYVLLFLARGRHPILMNKLRFEKSEVVRVDGKPPIGYWANRPRDLANLTRFASRELERGLNWQVVPTDVEWFDWLDSPVLYIASHQPPAFSDEEYEKLRSFVDAGGLLFTHADAGSAPFNKWAETLSQKIAPTYEMKDLPDDHIVYEVNYKIRAPKPKLRGVSNGTRLLIVHSPTDLATQWQQRAEKVAPDAFRLGVNLFLYAAGKTSLRNRLESPYIPEPTDSPATKVAVARVKYPGNWDPEPGAWPRFRKYMEWEGGLAVEHPPVELKELKFSETPVAHLTGNVMHNFIEEDAAAIKAFVEEGGVLLIDSCGGVQSFNDAVRDLLDKALPGAKGEPLTAEHPLLKSTGKEPLSLKGRPFTTETMKDKLPDVTVMQSGKGHVVWSRLDVTTGLLGTGTWGILGYEPDSAQALVRNVLVWSRSR